MTATPPGNAGDDLVSLTFRRTHLWGAGGLVLGIVIGVAGARALGGGSFRTASEGGSPAAAAPVPATDPGQPVPIPVAISIPTDGRPARGNALARVTVIEFTDYSCPFCRQHATTTLEPLVQRYGDRVRYVVMNFPIVQLHPDAPAAAEAAECAADQGRFWEYHDHLFRTQPHDRASLKRYARALRLDGARFDRCLDGGAKTRLVNEHLSLGSAAGVTGTPAFVIGGQLVEGAYPLDALGRLIDAALK